MKAIDEALRIGYTHNIKGLLMGLEIDYRMGIINQEYFELFEAECNKVIRECA